MGIVWSYFLATLHDKQGFPRLKMMNNDVCKFCYSNGEAESQYRTHQLKNSSCLVTCPVLRSFTCIICKATGDFAHTQRYCPRNKDGWSVQFWGKPLGIEEEEERSWQF